MKALSVLQPWASLLAEGLKHYETRSWATGYRGWVAIHASKKRQPEEAEIDPPIAMPHGAIIAVARLVACQRTDGMNVSAFEGEWGDFTPGRYAWEFRDVQKVAPLPCSGALGLWEIPSEIEDMLRTVAR